MYLDFLHGDVSYFHPSMTSFRVQFSLPLPFYTTIIFLIFTTTTTFPALLSADDQYFSVCSTPFRCGKLDQNLSYPFWGGSRPQNCGHQEFNLSCREDDYPSIEIVRLQYKVTAINQVQKLMTISRADFSPGCHPANFSYIDSSFIETPFQIVQNSTEVVTINYGCSFNVSRKYNPNNINCSSMSDGTAEGSLFFVNDTMKDNPDYSGDESLCAKKINVPMNRNAFDELFAGKLELQDAISRGFEVNYNNTEYSQHCSTCEKSGGFCGTDCGSNNQFVCFCRNRPTDGRCAEPDTESKVNVSELLIGTGGGAIFVILLCSAFTICCYNWRKKWKRLGVSSGQEKAKHSIIEAFVHEYKSMAPKRYIYKDILKMTNSFSDKLGQGGYGSVYKGRLLDGRPVAVKMLNASKGDGEDFVNEVTTISKTSHVNVVVLVGFCCEGTKRSLIYEFMANGSLEKFIDRDRFSGGTRTLEMKILYQIAVGIARGLEYLHGGCNTQILHFDIKPHNILLDENFVPKISDFGLAKLCPSREITLSDARGTIGYIAPEVFRRTFRISYKSDVYSYGMMILEMAGGRKSPRADYSQSSDIYFPNWLYKHLEFNKDLMLQDSLNSEENEFARIMIMVGLWCIQTDPSHRPSMNKVMSMLEERCADNLQTPPKPILYNTVPRSYSLPSTQSMDIATATALGSRMSL